MPFTKGKSGNPGGLSKAQAKARKMLGDKSPEAVRVLISGLKDKDRRVRVACATEILDRGLPRPVQGLEHSGPGGGPIETTAQVCVYLPDNGRKPNPE